MPVDNCGHCILAQAEVQSDPEMAPTFGGRLQHTPRLVHTGSTT